MFTMDASAGRLYSADINEQWTYINSNPIQPEWIKFKTIEKANLSGKIYYPEVRFNINHLHI